MSFKLDLKKAVERAEKNAEKVIRGSVFSVASKIIKRTPVGNPSLWNSKAPKGYVGGSLRGAWQASIGSPNLNPRKKVDKSGESTINDMSKFALNMNIGDAFFMTNSLPYAHRVEFGWSKQAPQGMVRVSVKEAQAEVNKINK